ncbi:MAG TPA: hypothetical protein VF465_22080, partial [Flavobacterium sp.]
SFPIYVNMDKTHKLDFIKNGIQIINVLPPENLDVDINEFYTPNSNENLFIWSESLTKMRKEMNNDNDARIIMGGLKTNFKGKYPGLLEESIYSLHSKIPTYFIVAFGGITKSVINSLLNNQPDELTEVWQRNSNAKYSEFIDFNNAKTDSEKIDYGEIMTFLNGYSLERLSENNGLTVEENMRLFETIHLPEILFLVLKGLKNTL